MSFCINLTLDTAFLEYKGPFRHILNNPADDTIPSSSETRSLHNSLLHLKKTITKDELSWHFRLCLRRK